MGHDTLQEALAAVQANLPTVAKSETADTGKFSYDYASLADVNRAMLPLLSDHGLTWVCLPDVPNRAMRGVLTHTSGDAVEATWGLPNTQDPQALGSAITYGRRYLLAAVTGLVPDADDDGQAAQNAPPPPKREEPKPPPRERDEDGVPYPGWLQQRAMQWVGDGTDGPEAARRQGVVKEWLEDRGVERIAELSDGLLVELESQLGTWEGSS